MATEYQLYWGEMHDNTYSTGRRTSEGVDIALARARQHLDFYAAAYYTACAEAFEQATDHVGRSAGEFPIILEGWKPADRLQREWAEVQEGTRRANEPGSFVTFPGYEWQGDGSSGDHNVFYFEEGPPIHRVNTLTELYARLRGHKALAIPHHTAYRPGLRGKDWSVHDDQISPFAEVYSVHGSSETDEEWIGLRRNSHMGPGFSGGAYQSALDRGLHVGAICSSDTWGWLPGRYDHGRAACLATALTREALWEAFQNRRVYGVTGDRIEIDYRLNGAPMGSAIRVAGRRRIEVRVRGGDALDRIEILRNGQVIHTHCHQGTWRVPATARPSRYKMRVECGWGPRPSELPARERRWQGVLRVDGGTLVGWEPCWTWPQTSTPHVRGGEAHFELVSSTTQVHEGWQNAYIFEFESRPDAPVAVELNELRENGSLHEFAAASRELWFRDECVRLLAAEAGITPGSPERDDVYYHLAYKAKVHRAVPEAAYTATVAIDDDEPYDGEWNYRVRVEQRNGQRAWTSPIWVRAGASG